MNIKSVIPDYVVTAADTLRVSGYEAYLVGGAVRNILLGKDPKDYDIATNALPEQIAAIFPRSVNTNAKFGTVLVILPDGDGENHDIEITTYRREEDYVDGRWPSKVEFATEIEVDLSRRDFTINAIAFNLHELDVQKVGLDELIFDPFNGRNDLDNKLIKAVGNPLDRFTEDGLRSFRACRLASELNFQIDEQTFAAISETLEVAKKISLERVRDEFNKLLKYSPTPSYGIELLRKSGLLELFIPELLETIGVNQPEWHSDDVYEHSLKTLDLAEDSIKLAALFHDIGKARTRSEDDKGVHFYGHDQAGAEMTKDILTRLRYPRSIIDRVTRLIRWHMFYYPSADWRKQNEIELVEQDETDQKGWTDSAIRRFIKNVGGEDIIDDLFKLRIADANANPKSKFNPIEIRAFESRIADVRAKEMALKITDLDVNGEDLQQIGVNPGPDMGKTLNHLLNLVIDDPSLNTKERLLEIVKEGLN